MELRRQRQTQAQPYALAGTPTLAFSRVMSSFAPSTAQS
jgi:hypothetical protein